MKKPYAIIILDGFGEREAAADNAITTQGTPNIDKYKANYPYTTLGASGNNVGLPDGQMGNSEVGHLNIGAGRIVYQELTKITKEIQEGSFFQNKALLHAIEHAKSSGKKLHILGLLSSGGVHSHIDHLFSLIDLCKQHQLKDVYIHCFLDGRDVAPKSGIYFVQELEKKLQSTDCGKIATLAGRFYAMDRNNRWERVEEAYNCMTMGEGQWATDAIKAIEDMYTDKTDEFIPPTNIVVGNKPNDVKSGKPIGLVEQGDSMIFFNFRPDRAREITRAFTEENFKGFDRKSDYLSPVFISFTQYDATFKNVEIAFLPQSLKNTLGEYLSKYGKKQLRIAETEKYAHVTFFFNGGVEEPNKNEVRALIPSPKVLTYDLQPEMSAYLVTDRVIEELSTNEYDVMILNFANCDMVGHTGVLQAAQQAVKVVDECVEKVLQKILQMGGVALLTADHGNADKMTDTDGSPFTAHTTNPVPCILIGDAYKGLSLRKDGVLADLAPTLLELMQLPQPKEMTGKSLIKH